MTTNLSHLARNWSGTGSMHAGNTVTDRESTGAMPAPGSNSEGTADVPSHDTPALDIPAVADYSRTPDRLKTLTGEAPSSPWQTVQGVSRDVE
jgi:hypothetical protein